MDSRPVFGTRLKGRCIRVDGMGGFLRPLLVNRNTTVPENVHLERFDIIHHMSNGRGFQENIASSFNGEILILVIGEPDPMMLQVMEEMGMLFEILNGDSNWDTEVNMDFATSRAT